MKVSYNWLQTYFKDPLPTPEELSELLTFHVFEIEELEKKGNDTVLDVKVLPDRAAYALSHHGIAFEIAAITGLEKITPHLASQGLPSRGETSARVEVKVEDTDACVRYSARYIGNVKVGPSPAWLKEKLEILGQRSINNVVDAANYVMLDVGQPLHAFDADKIKGGIVVRFAKEGEKITTLDNKEVNLDSTILVIADSIGPLAIAGIKGGMRAAVDDHTKNIIIESANFNPSLIRKTSGKIGIRTDASKRYENAVPSETTLPALEEMTKVVSDLAQSDKIGPITDINNKPQTPEKKISLSTDYIVKMLGVNISEPEISTILQRLKLDYVHKDGIFEVISPLWRNDIQIPQDIVEEVGRIYSYKKLPATELPATSFKPKINKTFYYSNKVRDILVELGFSEVYTYTLRNKGDAEILNPLASDKNFLRENLAEGLLESLSLNARNADILGLDQIKIFEIGKVFKKNTEYNALAFGITNIKKGLPKTGAIIRETLQKLGEGLGVEMKNTVQDNVSVYELNLDKEIEDLPEPTENKLYPVAQVTTPYKRFSVYPFAVRDIAVFTPEGTTEETVRAIIEKNWGEILLKDKIRLFDVFTKEIEGVKKTSYAFRMVFQSFERTLTEDEINSVMKNITDEMNGKEGWKVR